MKAISRKLLAGKPSQAILNISLSIATIALVAITLYFLINSPA